MAYLDTTGLGTFWAKIKGAFGASISGSTGAENYSISLKNKADTPATLGDSVVIPAATLSTDSSPHAGLLTPAEKSKLSGIAASTATPKMDGTASPGGSSTTTYSKSDHIHPTDTSRAPLASPALTGTPTAPTAAQGTNTTQIATTAFVKTAVDAATAGATAYQGEIDSEAEFQDISDYTAGWYWIIGTTFTHTLADSSTITLDAGNMVFANYTASAYSAGNFDIIQTDIEAIPDSVINALS